MIVVENVAYGGELRGYGEGLPITFVTGETPESTLENIRALTQNESFPWELNDVSQVWDFVDSFQDGKEISAALSSLEMSLLDILGKEEERAVIEYFPHDFYTDTIHYGGTIPLGDRKRVMDVCEIVRKMQIKELRIKMGDDLDQDKLAFRIVKSLLGDDLDIRIDPNRIWDRELALNHLPLIKEYRVKVVEEPMTNNSIGFDELADLLKSAGAILMACESAPTLNEVKKIVDKRYYELVNVKVGRAGGIRRALKIIDFLRTRGVSFQIGCSLGETGILSAAGRILGLLCRDAVYYDGSYDKFLLAENTTLEDVSFGPGGKAGPLEGPGLGVKVSSLRLEKLSNSEIITINNPN